MLISFIVKEKKKDIKKKKKKKEKTGLTKEEIIKRNDNCELRKSLW